MGLFDKLIKDVIKEVAPDVDVDQFVKSAGDIVKGLKSEAEAFVENLPEEFNVDVNVSVGENAESGDSWGPDMPDEPNQYNYDGTYLEYFTDIFKTEFGDYTFEIETDDADRPKTVIEFWDTFNKVLVVELMPETSEARRLRNDCAAKGIPYLRFYYNHDGWWNTRSYVVRRVKAALEG